MKLVKLILIVFILWFLTHEVIIITDGLNDNPRKSEYAVIYGNTVNKDGSLSNRLIARLEKGMELYFKGEVNKLYVSGGLGQEGFYEGTKMKEFLITKGIHQTDIIVDNKGNNTRLTALNFKSDLPNVQSVTVVTQFFHISRAKLTFKQIGIQKIMGAHADYYELRDVYSLFREFFGYYKYLLFY